MQAFLASQSQLQIATHGEAGRATALQGLDFIQAKDETLYFFPNLFRTYCYSLGLTTTAFSVHNGTAKKK